MPVTALRSKPRPVVVRRQLRAVRSIHGLVSSEYAYRSRIANDFGRAQTSLGKLSKHTASKWPLPHRVYLGWPQRCRQIARDLLRNTMCGGGKTDFPPGYRTQLTVTDVDQSPHGARYAMALRIWADGLLACVDHDAGFCLNDATPVVHAVAENIEGALAQNATRFTAHDKACLYSRVQRLRSAIAAKKR